jgi:hypothetical protein
VLAVAGCVVHGVPFIVITTTTVSRLPKLSSLGTLAGRRAALAVVLGAVADIDLIAGVIHRGLLALVQVDDTKCRNGGRELPSQVGPVQLPEQDVARGGVGGVQVDCVVA